MVLAKSDSADALDDRLLGRLGMSSLKQTWAGQLTVHSMSPAPQLVRNLRDALCPPPAVGGFMSSQP